MRRERGRPLLGACRRNSCAYYCSGATSHPHLFGLISKAEGKRQIVARDPASFLGGLSVRACVRMYRLKSKCVCVEFLNVQKKL